MKKESLPNFSPIPNDGMLFQGNHYRTKRVPPAVGWSVHFNRFGISLFTGSSHFVVASSNKQNWDGSSHHWAALVGGSNWSNQFSIRYLESKLADKIRQQSKNPKCTEKGPPWRSRLFIGQSNGWSSNSFGYGFAASILVPGQGTHPHPHYGRELQYLAKLFLSATWDTRAGNWSMNHSRPHASW